MTMFLWAFRFSTSLGPALGSCVDRFTGTVIIGAGTGVTAALSVLRELVHRKGRGDRVPKYCWQVCSPLPDSVSVLSLTLARGELHSLPLHTGVSTQRVRHSTLVDTHCVTTLLRDEPWWLPHPSPTTLQVCVELWHCGRPAVAVGPAAGPDCGGPW
jgi:hypothetical protein